MHLRTSSNYCISSGLLTDTFYISYPFFIRCTHRLTSDISSLVHHFSISSGVYIKIRNKYDKFIDCNKMTITRKLSIFLKAIAANLLYPLKISLSCPVTLLIPGCDTKNAVKMNTAVLVPIFVWKRITLTKSWWFLFLGESQRLTAEIASKLLLDF